MLKKLKSYLDIGNDLYGLEIFHEKNKEIYHLIHVQKAKQELVIVTDKRFDNWEKLKQFADKKIPICLTINSSEVLNKIIPKKNEDDYHNIVESSFPSLDFERFYFNIATFNASSYIAIIEKKSIVAILDKFKSTNISVLSFHIGLSNLSALLSYLDNDVINTNTKQIYFDNEKKANYTTNASKEIPITYSINGIQIDSAVLVSFGSVLQQLLATKTTHTNYQDSTTKLKDTYIYTRRFQVLLWPIISFFLVLLLTNFFVFNHFYEKQQSLELELNSNTSNKEKLIQLKENVALKEKRVEAILSNTNSRSTLYLDDIGHTLPNTVTLENINYQALAKPIQNAKAIEQNLNEIIISGETANNEDLSNWISILEKLNWVKQVETLSYGFKNNRSSFFSLKITING